MSDHARVHLGIHHLYRGHRLEQTEHVIVQQLAKLELEDRNTICY